MTSNGVAHPNQGVVIEARSIVKTYGQGDAMVQALRGVDLEIVRGEMVAVMGPSGCGKTTLLNVLSGMDHPDSGEVRIEGVLLNALTDNQKTEYRARRMGYIFQAYNLLPTLTAVENVELVLLLGGTKAQEARRKATEMLDLVGLSHRLHARPGQLSGGQCQRVAIARALANNPAIVWADEPTGALDSKTTAETLETIQRIHRELGQTIVMVTHSSDVGKLADRVIWMQDGRIETGASTHSRTPQGQTAAGNGGMF